MTKIYTTIIAVVITISAYAQIPNPSFEQWSGHYPTQWFSMNNDSANGVFTTTKSTDAHDGNFAVKLSAISFGGTTYSGKIRKLLIPITTKPIAMHYWAKGNFVNGDKLLGSITIDASNGGFGAGGANVTSSSSVYKEYIAIIAYSGNNTPTFANIIFTLANSASTGNASVGSEVLIDQIFFGDTASTAGIEENNNNEFAFESISPNPAYQSCTVIYNLSKPGLTNIALFDIYGKKIKDVVTEKQSIGRYKTYIETDELANGIYLCQLNVNGVTITKKIVVEK